MSAINREWHQSHRMPENPTELQRIAWHTEHARNCGCRAVDGGVARLFLEHGVPVPARGPSTPSSDGR